MSETYNVVQAIQAQKDYIKETGAPHFAPVDGRCWRCGQNIFEKKVRKERHFLTGEEVERESGITVEYARNNLITGCPHCNRSYCD